ncbi:hypothetical protein BCR32DRAFT_267733 [Anaeromyces robustus]|uniref:Uncharacterized protein n=1 Tax=Anaeromyces robustus TaxID=1754192 RepID=A0A1Y1X979_9FUNG|nr:hypothetical protein BCR32DRAFT_267733 [Anaeromyces robustus]|eukprot:ORX82295.1 hypothetical protein BCR32DRAFT_267733 [Anaeromyces robustus]
MEMDMEAEEFHGIFQFAADIDDDDDFFAQTVSKEERAMERMKKENSIATYQPKFLTGGYNIPIEKISNIFFGSKNGPNAVKQAIEWYYSVMKMKDNNILTKDQEQNIKLYKEISYQYIKDCCDKYLECNQSKGKFINEREILEIAIRCLVQMDRINEIEPYVERLDPKEPGLFAFSGKCYYLLKQYKKSLQIHQKYCDQRRNDYMSWLDMSNIFKDINNIVMNKIFTIKCEQIPDLYRLLYIICFVKAYKLLKANKLIKKTGYWDTVISKELNPLQKIMDENPNYEEIVEQTLTITPENLDKKINDFNNLLNKLFTEEVKNLCLSNDQIQWIIKHGKATIRESDLNDDENETSCLNIY